METIDNTTNYPIEEGVPVPDNYRRGGAAVDDKRKRKRPCKYPIELLEVSESFFVPIADFIEGDLRAAQRALVSSCYKVSLDHRGRHFTVRIRDHEQEPNLGRGVRVWRTR